MAGDNKQLDLRPADPFTRIDPKLNQVVPWSLHTFPENFMQIGPAVFKPPPPLGAGGGYMFSGRPSVRASVRASVRPSVSP